MHFSDLRLIEPIVRVVNSEGYDAPTAIQAKAIPHILDGRDLLGCAQTGTGKTGAFALPILDRLARSKARPKPNAPRVLVLAPTRELANQILESFRTYGSGLGRLRFAAVFGGVGQGPQVRALRQGLDVLVATPGRLMDLVQQGHVNLGAVETFVLDEADRMLDMGFINDIRRIAEQLPRRRQTLLFSATMPPKIRELSASVLEDPVRVEAAPAASTAERVEQSVYHVVRNHKTKLLERVLRRSATDRTIVFTRTKHGADRLVRNLRRAGVRAEAIHGNKTQGARTKALAGFKAGRTNVLVATDIASRGIDVDEVSHVVNYDLPVDAETYVHRIGRTARAGRSGIAISFCDHDQVGELRAIERLLKGPLEVMTDEPELSHAAPAKGHRPSKRPSGSGGGHRRQGGGRRNGHDRSGRGHAANGKRHGARKGGSSRTKGRGRPARRA